MTNENTAPAGESVCKGCWELGSACGKCSRCIASKPTAPAGELKEIDLLTHAEAAGFLPNTINAWMPALTRYTDSIIAADRALRASPAAGGTIMRTPDLVKMIALQAKDDGLWFEAMTAPEAYLQHELRNLHRVIEVAAAQPEQAALAAMTAERDHWKANHDAQVQRARLLIDRQDIPVERVKAYEQVTALTAVRDARHKDAERYRHVRDGGNSDYRICRYLVAAHGFVQLRCDPAYADKLIDAAMTKEATK